MARGEQYQTENVIKSIKFLINNEESMIHNAQNEQVKILRQALNLYDKLAIGTKDDIDFRRKTDKQFDDLFTELDNSIGKLLDSMSKRNANIKDLSNTYKVDENDVANAIDIVAKKNAAIDKKDEIDESVKKKIDEIFEKIKVDKSEYDNDKSSHESEIKDLESKIRSGLYRKDDIDKFNIEIKSHEDEIKKIEEVLNGISGGTLSDDEIEKLKEDVVNLDYKQIDLKNELNKEKIGQSKAENELKKAETKVNNNSLAKSIDDESLKPNTKEHESLELLEEQKKILEGINNNVKNVNLAHSKVNDNLNSTNKALAMLYKTTGLAFSILKDGANKWLEIEDRVKKVGRSVGLSHEQVRGYQLSIMNNYGTMAARLGMTIEELTKFQENYSKSTGRAITLTKEQVTSLASVSKMVGDVATNKMVENMDDFGASTKTATSYLAINMARAKASGLDAQKASEAFANNVKMASKFNFSEGINGISKMTLLSQQLKFNMESIGNAAEKFQSIEGAISTSANLQVLGGTFAQAFGNPLEAMNMALLDMEGFTQKVIDSVKGKAFFDREKGMMDMSALDKQFLRAASKELGISYDELFNMATQPGKIREVERQLDKSQNFSKDDMAFIANKAQYDPESGTFKMSYFDAETGKEENVEVDKISQEALSLIKKQEIPERAIQGDVHAIHGLLQEYIKKEAIKSTSISEHFLGIKEASATTIANLEDGMMTNIVSGGTKGLVNTDSPGFWGALLGGLLGLGGVAKTVFSKDIGGFFKNKVLGKFFGEGSKTTGSGQQVGGFWSKLKNFGKGAIGKVGRKIPYIGTAIAAIGGTIEAANAISDYSSKKQQIESDTNLTAKEKARAKTEAKKSRNESVGGAIGGAAGTAVGALASMGVATKVGAAIGSIIPGAGTAIGALAGLAIGAAGYYGGKLLGSSIGGAVTSEEQVEDGVKQNEELTPTAKPLSSIDESMIPKENREDETLLAVTQIRDKVGSVNGYLSVLVNDNKSNKKFISGGYYNESTVETAKNDNYNAIDNGIVNDYRYYSEASTKNDGNNIVYNNNKTTDTLNNGISSVIDNKFNNLDNKSFISYANTTNDRLISTNRYLTDTNISDSYFAYVNNNGGYDTKYSSVISNADITTSNEDSNLLFNNAKSVVNNDLMNNGYSYVNTNSLNNGFVTNNGINNTFGYGYSNSNVDILNSNEEVGIKTIYDKIMSNSYYDNMYSNNMMSTNGFGIYDTIQSNLYDSAYSYYTNGDKSLLNTTSSKFINGFYNNTNNISSNDPMFAMHSALNDNNAFYSRYDSIVNGSNVTPLYNMNNNSFIGGQNNNIMSNGLYNTDNIISTSQIGTPTYIKPIDSFNSLQSNNMNTNNNINVNVNGSLRLIGDKDSANVSINQLLNDVDFKRQLVAIVAESLQRNSNGGMGIVKDSFFAKLGGIDNNVLYGTGVQL